MIYASSGVNEDIGLTNTAVIKGVRDEAQHCGRVEVPGAVLMAWQVCAQAVVKSLCWGICHARDCLSTSEFMHLLVISS